MALTIRKRKYASGSSFMAPEPTKTDKATDLLGGVAGMMPGVNGKIATIGNTAANVVGGLIGDKNMGEGVSVATNGEAALTGGIKAASSGFAIGNTIAPGIGGVIGGGIGLVGGALGGLFGNFKKKKEAERMASNLYAQRVDRTTAQSAGMYGAAYASNANNYVPMGARGMKFKPRPNAPVFRAGGKATILGGQNHADGNETYGKGNPIVGGNEKLAETEREELVFDVKQSKAVEELVYSLTGGPKDAAIYAKLGTLVEGIILHETEDKSGKYTKQLSNGPQTK